MTPMGRLERGRSMRDDKIKEGREEERKGSKENKGKKRSFIRRK